MFFGLFGLLLFLLTDKMPAGLVVRAPGRVCGLVGELLIVPFRFASLVVDFEPGQRVLFREVPSVIERTGNAESLVMSACAGDCGRDGREVFGDALPEGQFLLLFS